MVQDHHVAVATLGPGELHPCVTGGHDRRAGPRGVVHALVHAHLAQHRVLARPEAGAQPRERDRHADEALLQRPPAHVEVLGLAVAVEAEAAVGLATGGEGGRQDLAGVHLLALAPGLIQHHAEAVARLQVLGEVDVVLEDLVGHRGDRRRRQPGLARSHVERAGDLAAGHDAAGGGLTLDHLLGDLPILQRQLDPVVGIAVEADRAQVAGQWQVEGDLRAGAQPGQRFARTGVVQHLVHHRGRDPGLIEEVAQGLPALHPQDLPAVARDLLLALQRQRRQGQGQGGVVDRVGRFDGVREARHDRGHQCADGGEQAGVHPVPARPALVEGGRKMLFELPMQGGVVEDVETFLEALLARAALIGIEHRRSVPGWPGSAGPNVGNIDRYKYRVKPLCLLAFVKRLRLTCT
ncbi:hypothetical protein D3C86_1084600 [compost metagenome]